MNDRYLYRAKRTDNGEWVEGDLVHSVYKIDDICVGKYGNEVGMHQVDESTICQCTGLKDKNGKLILENDIVETIYDGKQNPNYVVIWDKDDLGFLATNGKEHYETHCEYLGCCEEIIVIGNIFDNPELLEV